MKPVIGILCAFSGKSKGGCGWDNYNYVEEAYVSKVKNTSALPVLIPVRPNLIDDLDLLAKRFDGFLFIGGVDVHPSFYNEEPHPRMFQFDLIRDEMEIAMAKLCIEKNIPALGICRGLQVLNVASGGTLYQDIPTQITNGIQHVQKTVESFPTHHIQVSKGTFLYDIFGEKGFVNSHHHQCVKDLGEGFEIAAKSCDDVTEALIHKTKKITAVQWHPELLETKEARGIFEHFTQAIINKE